MAGGRRRGHAAWAHSRREKGGRGPAWVCSEAEGMGSRPFHMKTAFQMEMLGSTAALGQWPPLLRSPPATKKRGDTAGGAPLGAPPAWGRARGRALPGLPAAWQAAAGLVAQGPRGTKTCWKNANKTWGEGNGRRKKKNTTKKQKMEREKSQKISTQIIFKECSVNKAEGIAPGAPASLH